MLSLLSVVLGAGVPVLLSLCGLVYLICLRGYPLRSPRTVVRALFKNGASPRRALLLALAGTLGVGNIVGVADAMLLGGIGAIFWMWVSAILAMTLKYAEVVLALRHAKNGRACGNSRVRGEVPTGGAMYYIREGLGKRGRPFWGWLLAGLFSVLCLADALTTGCLIQANAVSGALRAAAGVPTFAVGLLLAIATGVGIVRGTRGISALTAVIVPGMAGLFIILSVAALARTPGAILPALRDVCLEAFSPRAAMGGVVGVTASGTCVAFLRAVRYGGMRGLISNEAGSGTAPMAHATAGVVVPAEQGFLGIVEVFIDTILLCTLPALVLSTNLPRDLFGNVGNAVDPMQVVLAAYERALGHAAVPLIAAAVTLFAYATLLCWAHYGRTALGWLCRRTPHEKRRRLANLFSVAFCGCAALGAVAAPGGVWHAADLAIGGMTVVNLAVLLLLRGEVRQETEAYFGKRKLPGAQGTRQNSE